MLYTEGNLTAEDAALRRIARSKLRSALHSLEAKSQSLVDSLVSKLSATSNRNLTADQLLTLVEQHPQLRSERAVIRRYVDAFPELADAVSVSRDRIQTRARRRIESALAPAEFARRFRFTRGLCC